MKKTLVFMCSALLIGFVSCSDDNQPEIDNGDTAEITLESTALDFTSDGGANSIVISASKGWSVVPFEEDWVVVNPMQGDKGKSNLGITAKTNEDSTARTLTIKIKSDNIVKELTIKQEEKYENDPPLPYDPFYDLKQEYNIQVQGLKIEKASFRKEQVIVNGRIDGKLWIGGYHKVTKVQLFEWESTERLQEEIEVDAGYGEKAILTNTNYLVPFECSYTDNSLIFGLTGGEGEGEGEGQFTPNTFDVYFIKDNKHIKTLSYHRYMEIDIWYNVSIHPWFEGILLNQGVNHKLQCYDNSGELLYTTKAQISDVSQSESINYFEYVDFNIKALYLARKNLETGTVVWKIESPLKDIPGNAREDSHSIDKQESKWKCAYYYTLYDGTKKNVVFELAIETGDITMLE